MERGFLCNLSMQPHISPGQVVSVMLPAGDSSFVNPSCDDRNIIVIRRRTMWGALSGFVADRHTTIHIHTPIYPHGDGALSERRDRHAPLSGYEYWSQKPHFSIHCIAWCQWANIEMWFYFTSSHIDSRIKGALRLRHYEFPFRIKLSHRDIITQRERARES